MGFLVISSRINGFKIYACVLYRFKMQSSLKFKQMKKKKFNMLYGYRGKMKALFIYLSFCFFCFSIKRISYLYMYIPLREDCAREKANICVYLSIYIFIYILYIYPLFYVTNRGATWAGLTRTKLKV